jgi:hypothetical protein
VSFVNDVSTCHLHESFPFDDVESVDARTVIPNYTSDRYVDEESSN